MTESSFKGVGGLSIATRSWRPAGTPRAVVVIVPGFNSHSGYYEIYPATIFDSLDRGETDVFTLSSEEIWDRERPHYDDIYWSQSDYLKIVNAVSQEFWNEPLDLKKWKVLHLDMNQDCMDNPRGFYDFRIVYFENSGIEFWHRRYQARLIEVFSWQGIIRWGDATFSDAILPGWGNANLDDFKVTADEALFVAERIGGSKVRQRVNNLCKLSVWLTNYSPVNGYTHNNWLVHYGMADFYVRINPFSGKFKVVNGN